METTHENVWERLRPIIMAHVEQVKAEQQATAGKVVGYGVLLGGALFGLFYALVGQAMGGYAVIGFLVCALIGCGVVYSHYYAKRNKAFKAQIVPQIVEAVCPGARYTAEGDVDRSVITSARLYNVGRSHTFKWEDTIRGRVGQTDFVYSEGEISHVEQQGKTTTTVVDFKGFIFEADFNKDFHALTVLSSERGHFGLLTSLFSRLKRCHLENVDFDKRYTTYTSDDVEARYLLTPALQERIMTLHEQMRRRLDIRHINISFHDGRMLIMVPTSANRFEVKDTVEAVQEDFLALCLMIDIVAYLNLNCRIWTKA